MFMLFRSIVLLTAILPLTSSDDVVLVEGHQPYKSFRAFRSQRRHDEPRIHSHDSIQDVIYAPLDGERIITKGIYYVNGKSKKDDQIYDSMLQKGAETSDELDTFFVTGPPQRTTVAVTSSFVDWPSTVADKDLQEVQEVKTTTRYRAPLRLVTIPPTSTTPLPPFKHRRPAPQPQGEPTSSNTYTVTGGKTSSEPWQMAALHPLPPLLPQVSGMLSTIQNALMPPPMPSNPSPVPPDPFKPITPVSELNVTYPFIPIGTSNPMPPPFSPPPLNPYAPLQGIQRPIHYSSFRRGSFNNNRNVPPIPLATAPGYIGGDAYVDSTVLQYSKKPLPDTDFSIDSRPVIVNQDRLPSPGEETGRKLIRPRSISGPYRENQGESESYGKLQLFARNHPTFMQSLGTRLPSKGSGLIPPKMNVGDVPRSALSPNEKLDLCCRKRAVNPACQSMCNFDVLNEQTLVSAFLTNVCPGPQLAHAVECASSKVDHTPCCEKAGLLTFQGGRCLTFCRAHTAQPTNPFEFLPCLQVFEYIKSCYRLYQTTNKNIFGD
ncbi:hypothetical protein V3C99_013235 [Haemonchus contortus]